MNNGCLWGKASFEDNLRRLIYVSSADSAGTTKN